MMKRSVGQFALSVINQMPTTAVERLVTYLGQLALKKHFTLINRAR